MTRGGVPDVPEAGETTGATDSGLRPGRGVRDRDVVLLAAACVVIVLGLQLLGTLFPGFEGAIGRPPTMIVVLVVVTAVVLGRALWAMLRH